MDSAGKTIAQILRTQVVVLGGSHAGLQVALAAAELGKQVIVIERKTEEKMSWIGEQIGTFNSKFLTRKGFGDYDLDEIVREFMQCSGYQSNQELISKYVYHSGEMLDHLLSLIPEDSDILDEDQWNVHQAYGHPTYPVVRGGYKTWASTICFRGKPVTTRDKEYPVGQFSRLKDINRIVMNHIMGLGGKWLFGTEAVQLTKNADGRVDGVLVKQADGSYAHIVAELGVADCLGNFGESGVQLAISAGGHLDNTPVKQIPIMMPGDASRAFGQVPFLLLNADGKRFVNESVPYAVPPAMERQRGSYVAMVTDSKWLDEVKLAGLHHGSPDFGKPEYIEQCIEDMGKVLDYGSKGYEVRNTSLSEREQCRVFGANTLYELASYLGYEGQALLDFLYSIEEYNEMCKAKKDTVFGKDPDTLLAVNKGPFFGCITELPDRDWNKRGALKNSFSGLHTDGSFRVLDADLNPIPGLYAVGNVLGYKYSVYYPTPCGGNFIGSAMTHGRLLGKQLGKM